MKRTAQKALVSLCSLAVALTPFFYCRGSSLLFFGEPKHPDKES